MYNYNKKPLFERDIFSHEYNHRGFGALAFLDYAAFKAAVWNQNGGLKNVQ